VPSSGAFMLYVQYIMLWFFFDMKALLQEFIAHGQIVDYTINEAKVLIATAGFCHDYAMSSTKNRYENLLAMTRVKFLYYFVAVGKLYNTL